jgi:branched-chain amino acid transport system substrate-binding protein
MAVPRFSIGRLPGYAALGVAAPARDDLAPAFYLMATAVVSIGVLLMIPETPRRHPRTAGGGGAMSEPAANDDRPRPDEWLSPPRTPKRNTPGRSMHRHLPVARVLLAVTVLAISGCDDGDGGRAPLVVGAIYNLSGAQAELDVASAEGAQLAVGEVNRGGGVLGRRVELALEDGETSADAIAAKAADLLRRFDSMPGLIGLSDTDLVLAAAPVAAAGGRLFLTSGATSPQLPAQVPEWLFLACFGDNVQAAAGAEWAYGRRSARTASILYSTASSYTTLLQGYFRTRFEQLGGEIVSVSTYTPEDLSEDTIRGVEPADIIYLSAQPEDALQAAQLLRAAGFSTPILGGDGFDSEGLWEEHPEISDVFFTTHAYLGADNQDPEVVAFREAYEQAHPGSTPDAFTALGYDTARLLLDAVERAGSDDPDMVRTALAATRSFNGVTGSIAYSAGSRIPSKSVTILQIDLGTRRFVEQLVPAEVPPP